MATPLKHILLAPTLIMTYFVGTERIHPGGNDSVLHPKLKRENKPFCMKPHKMVVTPKLLLASGVKGTQKPHISTQVKLCAKRSLNKALEAPSICKSSQSK